MQESEKTRIICTTLLVEKSPQALPLGAACIASSINHHNLTKDLCHGEVFSISMEDEAFVKANTSLENGAAFIAQKLREQKPEVVCFSVFVWNRLYLEKAAQILKEKGIISIAGGPEVTAHPQVFTAFDYVVTGEGEEKVPALIASLISKKAGSTGATADSVANKTDSGAASSDSATAASDAASTSEKGDGFWKGVSLEELSSPYLDGTINPSDFGGALWELARGCPFKCSYCYESKGEKTVRSFPMKRIEAELDLFAKKKIPQVFVLDPTYNANKNRALEILNLIAKKTPQTFYYFEARAEFIDRQLAHAFTKIPCAIQIGLQSANEEVLKLIHRPTNKKLFTKNIGFLNEEGAVFGFDLIFGLPGDTFKSFKESIDFAINLYPNNLELFCLSVLPGTDLFDRAEELHLTYDQNPPYHVLHTDKFSAQDLEASQKIADACNLFYNEGRAVPWFNTIVHTLKIKPSQFFVLLSQYLNGKKVSCKNHLEIEKIQKEFITELLHKNHLEKYEKLISDLISFNGALSRTQDTGKSEKIRLNYDCEYLASEYSTDLQFFIQNIKPKPNTTETFINKGTADFRKL